jgi:uncharacterized membrane-anchored protein
MNMFGDVTTGQVWRGSTAVGAGRAVSKVPQITAFFWIVKVLTTAQGEATSDYLVHRFNPVAAVGVAALVLAVSLILQFRVRRYVAWVYWLAVVMVAVFGTMVADGVHITLGVPYAVSTIVFAVVLAVIFVAWYATEKTLSIHSIYTRRREAFYWVTVMATFALGTAAGDMTAATLGLGYLASGILFAVVIAIPAIGYWRLGLNSVVAFWFAYIVTRPLGASFADWLGVPPSHGLGLGRGPVALGLTFVIIGFVWYLAVTRRDVDRQFAGRRPKRARHRRKHARQER